jgi:hypothetical protein
LALEVSVSEKENESAGEKPEKDGQTPRFAEGCVKNQIVCNRTQQDSRAESHDEADCAPGNGRPERQETAYQE